MGTIKLMKLILSLVALSIVLFAIRFQFLVAADAIAVLKVFPVSL
jgi:hypothetical protein